MIAKVSTNNVQPTLTLQRSNCMIKWPDFIDGITIVHNEHKSFYESAETYIESDGSRFVWKDEETKAKAIAEDSVWIIRVDDDFQHVSNTLADVLKMVGGELVNPITLPEYDITLHISCEKGDNLYLDNGEWQSEESELKAVENGEVWGMSWYPNTPVGCYSINSHSFEDLLKFARC